MDTNSNQTVLHIQPPTSISNAQKLNNRVLIIVINPNVFLGGQTSMDASPGSLRNLGREWAFEVGIVDHAGRAGIVRLSTFQV